MMTTTSMPAVPGTDAAVVNGCTVVGLIPSSDATTAADPC